ncbi:response regulator [Anaeromyxobacter oryzae]|nr:response regulator [Anaeromyxobacter oryzae]
MPACLSAIHAETRLARPIRVLLVEDDLDLRGALADLLRLERMEVVEAENGLDALLHLRTVKPAPDVIVLDLDMPVMSGREFREAQLREPTVAAVPVILLSSHRVAGVPAAAVLEKPCAPERLLATIARVAGAASPR